MSSDEDANYRKSASKHYGDPGFDNNIPEALA